MTVVLVAYVVGALLGVGILVRWENRRWFYRWALRDLVALLPEFERRIRETANRVRAFGVAADQAAHASRGLAAAWGVSSLAAVERMERATTQLRLAVLAELERRERARAAATADRS